MIAGEIESTFDDSYDYFMFGKKNKQAKTVAAPKARPTLRQKLQKVGAKIEKAGGVEAIGRTVDNVRSFLKKSDPQTAPPSDFDIGVKKSTDTQGTEHKDKAKKKKNLVMIGALVTGTIVILTGLAWWMSAQNKHKIRASASGATGQ